ncbi:hypothetical protein [Streptomyces lunaelactis]|uniref:hypothetical protein n=1 Tax=Streptomyces lunaelactis TaxID=1535768 RepID=UPI00158574E8|nr:hypothetical protein [Streptomyces lunaelactis]NUK27779.1 hypothetical protein [Streptomyces lunaelactis]
MSAVVIDDPLAVRFLLQNGATWTAELDGLPNPRLAADLARGLAENAHPHGGIGARNTANFYAISLRQMVISLSAAGFDGPAPDLTRGVLMKYWLTAWYDREVQTRMLLKGFDAVTGALRPEVRDYLAGNPVQIERATRPYRAYTDAEWSRLESACRDVVDRSRARRREALVLAAQGGEPRIEGLITEADTAWLLQREGPLAYNPDFVERVGGGKWNLPRSKLVQQVRDDLFPNTHVLVAYQTLFGMYCGIVPDGVDGLDLDDIEWAGDSTILLSYFKGRTSRESANLPKRAVRLLEQWLELSAPLRVFAGERLRDSLWLAQDPRTSGRVTGPPTTGKPRQTFVLETALQNDAGAPMTIHRGRIRATYQEQLARRGWTGRATIDPNHTARTEGDHYVTPTNLAQLDSVESIIEAGQSDLLRKALPPVVLTSEQAAQFVEGFPGEVERLGLDADAIAELVGGERDVFTAACTDQLAGLHGPAGKPCPARPWVCLLCPLAVFMPRHAGNLLRLEAFFSRQFRQMPTEQFLRVFGPYADRLSAEVLPKFTDEAKARGTCEVADDDTDLPLRPEESTR